MREAKERELHRVQKKQRLRYKLEHSSKHTRLFAERERERERERNTYAHHTSYHHSPRRHLHVFDATRTQWSFKRPRTFPKSRTTWPRLQLRPPLPLPILRRRPPPLRRHHHHHRRLRQIRRPCPRRQPHARLTTTHFTSTRQQQQPPQPQLQLLRLPPLSKTNTTTIRSTTLHIIIIINISINIISINSYSSSRISNSHTRHTFRRPMSRVTKCHISITITLHIPHISAISSQISITN